MPRIKAEAAAASIKLALDRHERGALLFSGGKDSIVLAHLAEPFKDRFDLVWVNTQGHFPHMVELVRSYGKRFSLIELTSDYAKRFRGAGPPTTIVPIYNTRFGAAVSLKERQGHVVSDWISCCAELRWKPMGEYFAANKHITLELHGQRKDENHNSSGGWAIERLLPLWNWTNDDVHAYVKAHSLILPEQYAAGCNSSYDCGAVCTARVEPEHLRWMKRRYPDLHKSFDSTLREVYGTVDAEMEKIRPVLSMEESGEGHPHQGGLRLPQALV